jgi:hypothetical protein
VASIDRKFSGHVHLRLAAPHRHLLDGKFSLGNA